MESMKTARQIQASHLWSDQQGEDQVVPVEARIICLGRFTVSLSARSLRLDGREVPLGSRAFDLLVVLIRSRGRLVTKEEIVREVWPSTFVDESNLRFQMTVLRKALGPERDRIKTITGRGYILVHDEGAEKPRFGPAMTTGSPSHPTALAIPERCIMVVEPDVDERNATTILLRALKLRVLSFRSVEEVAAFTLGTPELAAA